MVSCNASTLNQMVNHLVKLVQRTLSSTKYATTYWGREAFSSWRRLKKSSRCLTTSSLLYNTDTTISHYTPQKQHTHLTSVLQLFHFYHTGSNSQSIFHFCSTGYSSPVGARHLVSFQLKRCVHKLSKLQKVDLRKSLLKLWTSKRLKFN